MNGASTGADVATDHHLLVSKLKMKLKKNFTDTQAKRQKFNVGFLKVSNAARAV